MTHVIINFRRHLKRRNYSKHTIKYYLNIIKQYVIWVDVALELATPEKVDMYIDHLLRKRMNPASINLYLAIIRVFYDYLKYEENVDLINPVNRNRRLRVPRPLPRSLRDQEVEKLFGAIKNKRDIAMFKLMLRCGLRVEEVSNLTLGVIDFKRRKLIVQQGKGGKGRVVYISNDARDALIAY
jgi:site-specific recombinase XerD